MHSLQRCVLLVIALTCILAYGAFAQDNDQSYTNLSFDAAQARLGTLLQNQGTLHFIRDEDHDILDYDSLSVTRSYEAPSSDGFTVPIIVEKMCTTFKSFNVSRKDRKTSERWHTTWNIPFDRLGTVSMVECRSANRETYMITLTVAGFNRAIKVNGTKSNHETYIDDNDERRDETQNKTIDSAETGFQLYFAGSLSEAQQLKALLEHMIRKAKP